MHILINAWRDVHHPLAGGSEVLVDHLACGLSERGHTVTLRCGRPISEHQYNIVDAGGRFEQYLTAPLDYLLHRRHNDLVVDVANGMTYFTPLVRRRPTICFVHHVHTEHWAQWFGPALAALGRNLELHATPRAYRGRLFVAVSPSTATALEEIGVDPADIRIVHNGVDVATEISTPRPDPTFIAVGRLVPHKRYDVLARMWKRVRPHTGGELVIIGEGPERPKIEAVNAPGLRLAGKVSEEDKNRMIGEAWAMLHPASLEGWGLVVLEAAARGVPTIAFDAPGVRDSVVDGATGLLARTEDEYVDHWINLASDTARRRELGLNAKERALSYSWDRCVDEFEAVALEAVGAPARDRATSRFANDRKQTAIVRINPEPAAGVDTSVVVLVPSDGLPLRELFGRWRGLVALDRTELVLAAATPERESMALLDGVLAGFERCVPAARAISEHDEEIDITVAGRLLVVVDAARPAGVEEILAAVSDVHQHAEVLTIPPLTLDRQMGPWPDKPMVVTSCPNSAEAERLSVLVSTLGHYKLEAGRRDDLVVIDLRDTATLTEMPR